LVEARDEYFDRCQRESAQITMNRLMPAHGKPTFILGRHEFCRWRDAPIEAMEAFKRKFKMPKGER